MLFLFICTATRNIPSIKAVILFHFSAQGDDRVRVEKRDSAQFEFVSAINTVTEFYCHTQEKGVFVSYYVLFLFQVSYSLFPEDTHILTFRPKDKCFNCCLFLNVLPVTYGDGSVFVCPLGSRCLSSVASLESPVICCLGPLIQYLQEFNLERVLRNERYLPT